MVKTCLLLAGSLIANAAAMSIASPAARAAEARAAETATVRRIRFSSDPERTRVVIELDSEAQYVHERITNPDRVFFDILGAMTGAGYLNRTIPVEDGLLKRVRVAQNSADVVRVVLDISEGEEYSILELSDPFRIVIDLSGRTSRTAAGLATPESTPRPDAAAGKPDSEKPPGDDAGEQALAPQPVLTAAVGTAPSEQAVERETPGAAAVAEEPAGESSPRLLSLPPEIAARQSTDEGQAADTAGQAPASTGRSQGAYRPATEMPLTVTGSLSTGFYRSYTRGGGNESQKIQFMPAGAVFDVNGYYLTPELIDYWIQPEVNAGPQASDAGFEGGNGVRLRVSALRRVLPLTFRYSNVQLKDAYFGSLSQLSSYTRKNRNKEIGLTSELRHSGLPTVTIDWGSTAVNSESGIAMIPEYHSDAGHLNLNAFYSVGGWDFQGSASRRKQKSDLLYFLEAGSNPSLLRQKITEYQVSARRGFRNDSELYIDAGNHSTANLMLNQDIDLTTRYANANLRLFQRRRFKTSLRAGYTSNVAGLWLTRLLDGFSGSGTIAPDPGILLPFRRTVSSLNLNALATMDLSHGFELYSSLDRTAVLKGRDGIGGSRYLTSAAGVTYAGTFGWGSLSGQYGRSYGVGSGIGQSGRIRGQNYLLTAQPGRRDGLQFEFSIRGNDQHITNTIPADEHSFTSEGGVGFNIFGPLRIQLGGGWHQGDFTTANNDFHSQGFSARAGIEHPRFQLNGSLDSMIGNSFQDSGLTADVTGVAIAWLPPMQLSSSELRGLTFSLHAIPLRRLELSALWTRSVQHLEGIVANDFEIIDVYVTFHFRKLQFGAGFFRSSQIFTSYLATYPETERGRLYIRIVRTIKFL